MKVVAAICLGLAVLSFLIHAFVKAAPNAKSNVSFAWLGVAFLAAGVYFIPVAYVAFG